MFYRPQGDFSARRQTRSAAKSYGRITKPRRYQPRFDVLEDRCLMAASVGVFLTGVTLKITGTNQDDHVVVKRVNAAPMPTVLVSYSTNGGATQNWLVPPGAPVVFIECELNEGSDFFDNQTSSPCTVYGSYGNDTLWGGGGGDYLQGGSNQDQILGGDGNDSLYGGYGNDSLYGLDGKDRLDGQYDNDQVYGGAGNDTVYGSGGADMLYGGSDNDTMWGGDGNDGMYGDYGDDSMSGQAGHDTLVGETGRDTLLGNDGNDRLFGMTENDRLYGGTGKDSLDGGDNDDYLRGGDGNDTFKGGPGIDTFRRAWLVPGTALGLKEEDPLDDENAPADEPTQVIGAFLSDQNPPGQDSYRAVKQQGTPTCAFLAALAGVANWTGRFPGLLNNSDLISRIRYDAASDQYGVKLYINSAWHRYWVNGDWTEYVDPEGPLWVTLYQKAYLVAMGVQTYSSNGDRITDDANWIYSNTDWQTGGKALTALTGYASFATSNANFNAQTMRNQLLAGDVLAAGTSASMPAGLLIEDDHAYMVKNVYQDASNNWRVTVYNPWGNDSEPGDPTYGDPNDGIVDISWSGFTAYFQQYVRA